MKQSSLILEEEAGRCETEIARLKSFVKTLKETAAKHGTDSAVLEEDLTQAECNILFYESELELVKGQLAGKGGGVGSGGGHVQPRPQAYDSMLPRTPRQGAGALILASLGMLAGMLIGSQLSSRRRGGGGDR